MAHAVVQWVKTNSGSTASFANTTAGNLLVACINYNSATITVSTAKTPNNTFAAITGTGLTSGGIANATGVISSAIFYKANVTAETAPTFTITWSGTAPTTITIDLFEVSGSTGTIANGNGLQVKSATVTLASGFTPAYTGAFIVGNFNSNATAGTTGTNFSNTDLAGVGLRSGYVIQGAAALWKTWGSGATGNTQWAGAVVAFAPVVTTLPALSMSLN